MQLFKNSTEKKILPPESMEAMCHSVAKRPDLGESTSSRSGQQQGHLLSDRPLTTTHSEIIDIVSRPPSMKKKSDAYSAMSRPKTANVTKRTKSSRKSAKAKLTVEDTVISSPVIRALSARDRVNYRLYDNNSRPTERNTRLCKQPDTVKSKCKSANPKAKTSRTSSFMLTRPQYLQYIKSSTGIIEEDYFADLFPEVDDEVESNSDDETR